jgi:hypothetical protein
LFRKNSATNKYEIVVGPICFGSRDKYEIVVSENKRDKYEIVVSENRRDEYEIWSMVNIEWRLNVQDPMA